MLDKFDRKLLTLLQRNGCRSYAELGLAVGLSSSAVLRRIERLKQAGTIVGTYLVVDPSKVDRSLTLLVALTLGSAKARDIDAVKATFAALSEVQQCYHVTGETDILLIMTARNMDEYAEFTRRYISGNALVQRFTTSIVLDRVKSTLAVPI